MYSSRTRSRVVSCLVSCRAASESLAPECTRGVVSGRVSRASDSSRVESSRDESSAALSSAQLIAVGVGVALPTQVPCLPCRFLCSTLDARVDTCTSSSAARALVLLRAACHCRCHCHCHRRCHFLFCVGGAWLGVLLIRSGPDRIGSDRFGY